MVAGAGAKTGKELAKEWAKKAKAEATFDVRQRDEGSDIAAEEFASTMGWIKS